MKNTQVIAKSDSDNENQEQGHSLSTLDRYLFSALDRLHNIDRNDEKAIEMEIERSKGTTVLAQAIFRSAELQLRYEEAVTDRIAANRNPPTIFENGKNEHLTPLGRGLLNGR